jgi:hypothetical protein
MGKENTRRNGIPVLIFSVLFLFTIGYVGADLTDLTMPRFYEIELDYDNGEIKPINKNLKNAFVSERIYPESGYGLRLVSFNGEELYNTSFGFGLEISVTPPQECMINGTVDPEKCPDHVSYIRLNESSESINVPYYPMGKSILIYDSGELVLDIDVSEYSNFCGNGKCDDSEDYFTCPNECDSGKEDGYCDGLDDRKCDPDCEPIEDIDCSCPDMVCQAFEAYETCPQDCTTARFTMNQDVLYIMVVVIVVIVIIIIILKTAGKREKRSKQWKNVYKKARRH